MRLSRRILCKINSRKVSQDFDVSTSMSEAIFRDVNIASELEAETLASNVLSWLTIHEAIWKRNILVRKTVAGTARV